VNVALDTNTELLFWTEQKRKSSSSYAQIKKQTGDSALVQSKGTKTTYILILCDTDIPQRLIKSWCWP